MFRALKSFIADFSSLFKATDNMHATGFCSTEKDYAQLMCNFKMHVEHVFIS